MWLFAYGSLIFRPGFRYVERRRAFVRGFARRFWQGSPDHRGTPEAPGRVVTLVPDEGAACGGCAFRIDPHEADGVLSVLDVREQAGFERHRLALFETDEPDRRPFAEGITWVARAGNEHYLGPLAEPDIAAVIRERHGPSGSNAEYALRLRDALRSLEIVDPHVEAVVARL